VELVVYFRRVEIDRIVEGHHDPILLDQRRDLQWLVEVELDVQSFEIEVGHVPSQVYGTDVEVVVELAMQSWLNVDICVCVVDVGPIEVGEHFMVKLDRHVPNRTYILDKSLYLWLFVKNI